MNDFDFKELKREWDRFVSTQGKATAIADLILAVTLSVAALAFVYWGIAAIINYLTPFILEGRVGVWQVILIGLLANFFTYRPSRK